MIRGLLIFALFATNMLGLFVAPADATESVRFRLSLEFERSEQVFVGSGVVELSVSDTRPVFKSMGGVGTTVRGEAVATDFGDGQLVLALLRGPTLGLGSIGGIGAALYKSCSELVYGETDPLETIRKLRKARPKKNVALKDLPMLVHFRDRTDPKSVEQVNPENVAAVLGPATRLRAATIEVVDDEVSFILREKLPWLSSLSTQLDGRRYHDRNTLANELNTFDFERGLR